MNKSDELVLVFTGTEVEIEYIRAELQNSGIATVLKDGFAQGLKAGFVADTNAAVDLYVLAMEAERASEIINALR
ncbi:MAG: DUF2007 domain-containing protein [Draconibacterium sp.]